MKYNWKKHVKHSSKKNVNKRKIANYISNKMGTFVLLDNHYLRQRNSELRELIDNIERKLRD